MGSVPDQVPESALQGLALFRRARDRRGDYVRGGAATTAAVGSEPALADPPAFDAVTCSRTVEPTS